MNCEDFLPSLEGGGAEAEAARRHADECASCRAAAAMLDRVKAELVGSETTPAAMRAVMLNIADNELSTRTDGMSQRGATPQLPGARGNRPLWYAALAASLVLAALGAWHRWWPHEGVAPRDPLPGRDTQIARQPIERRRLSPITTVTEDPKDDLSALADKLAVLRQSLADAKADAETLAVSQALDRVLLDFRSTVASSESR